MSGDEEAPGPAPQSPREVPAPIATRAAPPRPRRLSRRAITLFAGGSAVALAIVLGIGFTKSHRAAPQETVAVDHRQPTDLLATAPKDYAALAEQKAAALGPPPVIPLSTGQATGSSAAASSALPTNGAAAPPNPEAAAALQRQRQQRDSARLSKLFAASGETTRLASAAEPPTPLPTPSPSSLDVPGGPAAADPQDRKAAFVVTGGHTPTVNSGRLRPSAGHYVVLAGSTIAAALVTGLSSDLPGEVVAQVTEDVFDSTTGRTVLVPQGTRLLGSYDAHVTYGQSRALVVWTRLILPDGRSLDLDRLIGTDAAGQSGFADRVDHHLGKLLEAGLISTLFGVGSNVATGGGNNNDIAFAIRDSAGQSVQRAGDKLVEHQLDVQPTITVRPGARVRVLVSRDLVLTPWRFEG